MSTPIAAERLLISNAQFLEELERFDHAPDPDLDSRSSADAFNALKSRLPADPAGREIGVFGGVRRGLPTGSAARETDAFHALESGLPMHPDARETGAPHHERSPLGEPYEPPVEQLAPVEKRVPFLAAAFVLVACVTAGAATAALVFHDRVTQITAQRSANR